MSMHTRCGDIVITDHYTNTHQTHLVKQQLRERHTQHIERGLCGHQRQVRIDEHEVHVRERVRQAESD